MSQAFAISPRCVFLRIGICLVLLAFQAETQAADARGSSAAGTRWRIGVTDSRRTRGDAHFDVSATENDGTTAQFSGVNVADLLAKVGVPQGDKLRGEWLRCHVIVTASDEYRVAFGVAEVLRLPPFGGRGSGSRTDRRE